MRLQRVGHDWATELKWTDRQKKETRATYPYRVYRKDVHGGWLYVKTLPEVTNTFLDWKQLRQSWCGVQQGKGEWSLQTLSSSLYSHRKGPSWLILKRASTPAKQSIKHLSACWVSLFPCPNTGIWCYSVMEGQKTTSLQIQLTAAGLLVLASLLPALSYVFQSPPLLLTLILSLRLYVEQCSSLFPPFLHHLSEGIFTQPNDLLTPFTKWRLFFYYYC